MLRGRRDDLVGRREPHAGVAPARERCRSPFLGEPSRGVLDEGDAVAAREETSDRGVVADVGGDAEDDHLVRRERLEERLQIRIRERAVRLLQDEELSTPFDEARHEQFNRMPPMVHPLVWTQSDGRKSLVVGTHADEVVGMPYTAGRSLLARLMEWAAQPDFFYSHDWELGDFVIWNNCGVMHRVVPYAEDSGRNMHRTSIAGNQHLGRPLRELAAA